MHKHGAINLRIKPMKMTLKDLYILCHLCLETAVEQSSVDLSDEDDEILCNIQARGRRLTGYSGKGN